LFKLTLTGELKMALFQKAERTKTFIKLAITGPSGSGKTYSAIRLARGLVGPEGRIAFLDTENNSGTLYSELTEFFHASIEMRLGRFDYRDFITGIKEAEKEGYGCVIIDSASHLWQGILEEKSAIDKKGGNSFTNWADPSLHFNEAIRSFLQAKIHVISCMRSKIDYILEESQNAKGCIVSRPKKLGLAPIMREGIEYEFTTVFDVEMNHECVVSKDRTKLFIDYFPDQNRTFQITEETGQRIADWLSKATKEEVKTEWGALPPPEKEKPFSFGSKITETQPNPSTIFTHQILANNSETTQEIPSRERALEVIKQGVITSETPDGVITPQEYKDFCTEYKIAKVSDLPTEQIFEFATKIQTIRNLKKLINSVNLPPSKVNEIFQTVGATSLFAMKSQHIETFENMLKSLSTNETKN
jgi:DNA polymerase III delta prime subunit